MKIAPAAFALVVALAAGSPPQARAFHHRSSPPAASAPRRAAFDAARLRNLPPSTSSRPQSWALSAKKTKTASSSSSSSSSRSGTAALSTLESWSKNVAGIQSGGVRVASGNSVADSDGSAGGLGLVSDRELKGGDVLVQVPTDLALQVESKGGSFDRDVEELLGGRDARRAVRDAPWWVRMSLKVNAVDKVSNKLGSKDGGGVDAAAWLDSLPRKFDTPFHWSDEQLDELQYGYMADSVRWQRNKWKAQYDKISGGGKLSYDDFVWGCETARSRCFSGPYSGTGAFDPKPYALTLFLIAAYVGGGLGTIEQAANGAALVLCGTVLKDFVFPKFLGSRKYVLCPYIDMANHDGTGLARGNVAFEYFADGYSLSVLDGGSSPIVRPQSEVFISYGPRSNDQLLQYYGFVERGDPHDVYVLPPLREWDVAALERATGRTIMPGRLEKLERAGLLGRDRNAAAAAANDGDDDDDDNANAAGGVVITRTAGLDPAVLQALRALMSTDDEWNDAGESVGNFAAEESGGPANERAAMIAARTAMESELSHKPTTRGQDEELLKKMEMSASANVGGAEERLAVAFRAEKKRVLEEAIAGIRV
uniref:Rubisco LSMT substrate-binding domain-containing protein n=1 Tax=Odontella aurita TaxID=265563 RepID=A0A7S4MXS8_9STRA|mmetsp:Transcript_38666/g.116133  ORF Transcript_38666/g.116133 Transcript_38666/m.116133 type:complete len:595 (+) Transcript_38666:188-1972(+)